MNDTQAALKSCLPDVVSQAEKNSSQIIQKLKLWLRESLTHLVE